MIIGIHPDRIGHESYSKKWSEFIESQGFSVKIIDLLGVDALDQARQCDGIMWRWAHNPQDKQSAQRILYTIEHHLGIPVFPDSHTAWHYDEKISQLYLLEALQVPTPQTWLFWLQEDAENWLKYVRFPVVFKLSTGAGSANVLKIMEKAKAEELILRAFTRGQFPYSFNEYQYPAGIPRTKRQLGQMMKRFIAAWRYGWRNDYPPLPAGWWRPEFGYVYFQEFLPDNDFDTRITVIGDRAFGFRRFNRAADFRASGSGHIDHDPAAIDHRCVEMAFEISDRGAFQSMAYDFLFREGEPVVCEISYAFADWAVHDCPGHWDANMNWVKGHMWPEEAQVEDFVQRIRIRS